ncbi:MULTISPECIES: transglycosylase family protein [Streptomyces]|uniref:transglycosylase family protein n=1 Tax=Streptomyces TaxID=1883 RepID=UPI003320A325
MKCVKLSVRSSIRGAVRRGSRRVHRSAVTVVVAVAVLSTGANWPIHVQASSVWDRVASCESGGNWQSDTGNGYYGGLQFSNSTWRTFGGFSYAQKAAQASRMQQISVAKRVLAAQGWGAWPACSVSLMLKSNSLRSARNNPQLPRPKFPDGKAKRRQGEQTYVGLRHVEQRSLTYFVRAGDTLSGISFANRESWRLVYQLNRLVIGENPNLIFPGMRLLLA